MARQMTKNVAKFDINESPVVEENERILKNGLHAKENTPPTGVDSQTEQEQQGGMAVSERQDAPTSSGTTPSPAPATKVQQDKQDDREDDSPAPSLSLRKSKKKENGITVYIPMKYYERIAIMKMRTGIPIRDIAQQAIIEFLDNHKI